MDLNFEMSDREGTAVVALEGEVDLYTSPQLREKVIELVDAGCRHVIVDLEKVEFIDSTGLGVLVACLNRLRGNGGDLSLVCTVPRILKVFEITGLLKVFAISDSQAAALGDDG